MLAVIALDVDGDWLQILWISAATGALASLVAELLVTRGTTGDGGGLELPSSRPDSPPWYDLGSLAAIPLGILAGVIAGFALTPDTEIVKNGVVTERVDLDDLLLVAALAGLSSTAFLRIVQERFVASARQLTYQSLLQGAASSLGDVAQSATRATAAAPTTGAIDTVQQATTRQDAAGAASEIGQEAVDSATVALAAQAEQARRALLAAAGTPVVDEEPTPEND